MGNSGRPFAPFFHSIHALCIQQEDFTTGQPLLASEEAKKLCQTLFLKLRSYASMLKFPLFPNEQLSLRYGHTGHSPSIVVSMESIR